MRKTVKLGVAFAIVVLIAILSVGFMGVLSPIALAEELSTPNATDASNYDVDVATFVETLCKFNAVGDKDGARRFIANSFRVALGEEPVDYDNDASEQSDSNVTELYFQKVYCNIEAKLQAKDADTKKQIIIGAHYDATGEGDAASEGAGDNVCGVAALYLTLKSLVGRDLPYNVKFVAFDGEEDGLVGSSHYVNNNVNVNATLVMFNVDSIAHGNNLYLMCENKSTNLAKLILKNSQGIKEKPYARGISFEYDNGFGYGYYEIVQGGDHTPFRLAGIPIAFFFSGAYSFSGLDYGDVINTSRDTFANLPESFTSRIQTVSEAIVNTVVSDEFVSVAENARSQLVNLNFWYNALWPTIAVGVILLALVVGSVFYNRKLQKQAILGTAEIKSQKVFEKPAAEDIFTFKDADDKQKNQEIEDIFTFKK